jgi:hypothetical protein
MNCVTDHPSKVTEVSLVNISSLQGKANTQRDRNLHATVSRFCLLCTLFKGVALTGPMEQSPV